ncbi:MAG: archaellin/type IV pilin N-terminal domain-containing protein [Candidatus Hodarchaeota archaeon]
MKLIGNIYRKSRGISPVIATVLLIGLTVVAGVAVAIVMFGVVNTSDPLKVEVQSISDFKTTDNDILIDQFSVTLENKERSNVRIEADAFLVTYSNRTEIPEWSLDLDFDSIILPALTIETFTLACNPIYDHAELSPQNDSIYIEVTVFPEESTNPRNAKTFKSDILWIGDTIGPVYLISQLSATDFDITGYNFSLSVTNNGSTNLDLRLEFSTDSSESLYFVINGNNQTIHYFSLDGYSTTNFSSDTFTLMPTAQTIVDNDYFILITLWNQASINLLASTGIILTFTG